LLNSATFLVLYQFPQLLFFLLKPFWCFLLWAFFFGWGWL